MLLREQIRRPKPLEEAHQIAPTLRKAAAEGKRLMEVTSP